MVCVLVCDAILHMRDTLLVHFDVSPLAGFVYKCEIIWFFFCRRKSAKWTLHRRSFALKEINIQNRHVLNILSHYIDLNVLSVLDALSVTNEIDILKKNRIKSNASVMESRWCIERNTSSCTFTVFHTFQWRKMTLMTISSHVTANAFIIMRKSSMDERLIEKTDLVSFKPISYFISPMDYHYARYANRVIDTRWENPIFHWIDEKRYDVMREMRLWLQEFYTFFSIALWF